MDEDAIWYGSRPRRRPHCIRRVPSDPRKGHSTTPSFRPMSIVATVAHLSYCWALVLSRTVEALQGKMCQNWRTPSKAASFDTLAAFRRGCVSLSQYVRGKGSPPLPTYWYHSKSNWLRYNYAADSFWATVCKTVRPMLSVRCLSVLSCLWPVSYTHLTLPTIYSV